MTMRRADDTMDRCAICGCASRVDLFAIQWAIGEDRFAATAGEYVGRSVMKLGWPLLIGPEKYALRTSP
jgi:hypothetical protein